MDTSGLAEENLLFKCRTGSHAYGMATPASDLDIRGVFAADRMSVITPFFPVEQIAGPPGTDEVYFELSKYVRLACDQNPNILELLWVDPSDVLFEAPAWRLLREARDHLLTTRLRMTYAGYAMQQLRRMTAHSKWLNNPQPEEPPRPMDFVSMVHNLELGGEWNARVPREGDWTAVSCGKDLYLLLPGGDGSWFDGSGALRAFSREEAAGALASARPAAIVSFAREEYEARKRNHENYWAWRRNRNKERSALEARMGYDGKNAAHLIRLMRTAREALVDGVVRVRRPDAEELLAIRRGEWSYERIIAEAEAIDAELADAEKSSPLPRGVDRRMVGEILLRMYEMAWDAKPSHRPAQHLPGR